MLSIEGKIVNHDKEESGRIEINTDTGLIEKVSAVTGKADILLGNHEIIFPGFGDMHIHAREDESGKWNYKEDFISASKAAIHGGVTFAMDMTNNSTPLINEEVYLNRKKLSEKKSTIDLLFAAPIGSNTRPFAFPTPYKLFMTHSVGDLFFNSKKEIEEAVKKYAGKQINFHCEDPEILEKYRNQLTHEKRRPAEAEISGIDFALELIEKYNLSGRICHLSTKRGLEKITEAKKRGAKVVCEVTPHHLYFAQSAKLRMNPPLRTQEDRDALIAGLKNGKIDFLATDHAPHSKEEIDTGISGLPLLDTYGAFTTWLIEEHSFTYQDIARICSYNPAIYAKPFLGNNAGEGYGKVEAGFIGSLTVLDMSKSWLVNKESLQTKSKWSPFLGKVFAGSIKYAIIRGKVYENIDSPT